MEECKGVQAVVLEQPNVEVNLHTFTKPVLEKGAVLLETIYSEVCGTDCHLFHGKLAGVPYPIIPGHVSVGRIHEMNGEVSDINGQPFVVGDVVAFLDVHETCGQCWHCLVAKASTRCPKRKVYGITYSSEQGLLGGWGEYIYLKPGVKILRLPQSVTPEIYISGGCGLPTAFHAIERTTLRMGDTVVIQGSGPVGLCCTVFARLRGAGKIIVIGAPAFRLDLAKQFGADVVINIEHKSPEERLKIVLEETYGRGADVTVEACGNPKAISEGVQMTRDNGVYVIVGQYTDNGSIDINPHLDINKKHLDIRGCWGCDYSHLYLAIQMMGRTAQTVPWTKMITAKYSLKSSMTALRDVEGLKVIKAVIDPQKKD